MSVHIVYYDKRVKKMRPVLTEAEYRQLRDSARQKTTLAAVRQGNEREKMHLVQMNYSCLPNEDGTLKGTTRVSMSVGMDVDLHREDFADEEAYRRALAEIPARVLAKREELGLLMLERSATKGYHLVFRRRFLDGLAEGKVLANQERNLRWASDLLGVEFDKGAKDITRVFFSTSASEEDLIYVGEELFRPHESPLPLTLPPSRGKGVAREGDEPAGATCVGEPAGASEGDEPGMKCPGTVAASEGEPAATTSEGEPAATSEGEPTVAASEGDPTGAASESEPSEGEPTGAASEGEPVAASEGEPTAASEGDPRIITLPSPCRGEGEGDGGCSYLGIPYSQIIRKWWELYNDGQEPCSGNRNTLTFELAVNLRHICGFDRNLLNKVIPNYWASDGNSQSSPNEEERGGLEKLACIDSALGEKRTQMPKRLKEVLMSIRQELLMYGERTHDGSHSLPPERGDGQEMGAALDAALAQDELYHYDRLPKLPQGVNDSIEAAGHPLAMPTLIAIAPAIGALATGVKLDVHGQAKGLNLCSFVVGDAGSGKGQMDDVVAAWMSELQAEADIYTEQEEEWAAKKNSKKSGTVPQEPKLPVRMLTLVNTVPNIAERLANTEGKHSFSYTPEADNVAMRWKQSVNDFSSMLRQAYDESRYDREARSAEAVRVHIEHLRWNVVMCGTQDALYRVITNYTDGLLSRMAIARTPDNTFSPLADNPARMTDVLRERIQQVAHILPLMKGTVVLPKLEERGRQWLETIRLEAMKNDDRVLARQRMRGCVNAQRITAALWLPKVAELLIKKHGMNGAETRLKREPELWVEMLRRQQTDEMLQLFDIVADYLIDNDLYFFRDRIEQAYESKNYQGNASAVRARKGKNDNIFERLADEFTFEQAVQQSMAVKGSLASRNSVHQMLKNWRKQGLCLIAPSGHYMKVKS